MKRVKPTAVRAAVWRWHFYAGLVLAPIILAVTVTGMVYIWADEWEHTVNRDLFVADPAEGEPASIDAQALAVREAYPGADLTFFSIKGPGYTNSVFFKTEEGYNRYVYINPYTAEVQGSRNHSRSFMPIMRRAHRTLYMGTTGRVLAELATSWTIILLLTGVYLWWPRPLTRVAGVWLPRLRRRKPYLFWRDLHSVPAAYITAFALIIAATGLFYTLASGTLMKLGVLATSRLDEVLLDPPAVSTHQPTTPATRDQIVAAVIERTGARSIGLVAPHGEPTHTPGDHNHEEHLHITLDDYDPDEPVLFDKPWFVEVGNKDDPESRGFLYVDPYTAEVLLDLRYSDAEASVKIAGYMYPLHVGSVWGTPTKILATLTCLLIIAMVATGIIMWWVRRPRGRSGFMPLPDRYRWPIPWWAAIAVCSIVMPVFAVSVVLVVLLERLVWLYDRFTKHRSIWKT
ncbi:MAG: PepSY-associated TM helix domain-containing protein [Planctomycetota bacterium]